METTKKSMETQDIATIKTIYERRAVRKYQGRTIDDKILERILDAGRMGPFCYP